jgi:hypothetical protein
MSSASLRSRRRLHPFGAESLHDTHAADRLLDDGGEFGLLGLHLQDGGVDRRREPPSGDVDERQRRQRDQRQNRVGHEQDDRRSEDHPEIRHRDRDHHHERLDLLEVARRAAHQLAGLGAVVVPDVQRHDVVEQPLAQSGLGPACLSECVVTTQRSERADGKTGDGDQQHPEPEPVALVDPAVDAEPHEDRHGDLADHPQQADQRADDQIATLVAQRGGQQLPARRRVVRIDLRPGDLVQGGGVSTHSAGIIPCEPVRAGGAAR